MWSYDSNDPMDPNYWQRYYRTWTESRFMPAMRQKKYFLLQNYQSIFLRFCQSYFTNKIYVPVVQKKRPSFWSKRILYIPFVDSNFYILRNFLISAQKYLSSIRGCLWTRFFLTVPNWHILKSLPFWSVRQFILRRHAYTW